MPSKKTIEIDKGVYKLLVEVEIDEEASIPEEISSEVIETIAQSVEKSKRKKKS